MKGNAVRPPSRPDADAPAIDERRSPQRPTDHHEQVGRQHVQPRPVHLASGHPLDRMARRLDRRAIARDAFVRARADDERASHVAGPSERTRVVAGALTGSDSPRTR